MTAMKAAQLTGIRRIDMCDVPAPVLERPGDVLLRVEAVGVCGSDMHYFRTGRIGTQVVEFPWLVGHECAGTVLRVGRDVRDLRPGDRVAVDPLVACGRCDQCTTGRRHTCRNQKFLGCPGQLPGALAEQFVMPAESCFAIPDSMTMSQAALTEPFSIGLYAARLAGEHFRGDNTSPPIAPRSVAIFGCGPIGLCVQAAIQSGGAIASDMAPPAAYMTDIRDERTAMALRFGAVWTGNPRTGDVVAAILAANPLGVEAAFECAGEQETIDQALAVLRPGGALVLVGIPTVDRVSMAAEVMRRREIRIINVRRQNECVGDAVALVASGKAKLDAMVTHEFTLDQTGRAFELVADYRDNVVKAMIYLQRVHD